MGGVDARVFFSKLDLKHVCNIPLKHMGGGVAKLDLKHMCDIPAEQQRCYEYALLTGIRTNAHIDHT